MEGSNNSEGSKIVAKSKDDVALQKSESVEGEANANEGALLKD